MRSKPSAVSHQQSPITDHRSDVGHQPFTIFKFFFIVVILPVYNVRLTSYYVLLITFFLLLATSSASAQKANEAIKQGNDAYRKNDFPTAIKDYTKALQADDKNAIARFNMANAWQRSSNDEKASDAYDDVVKNTNDVSMQSKSYYNKAISLLEQKKLPAAIDAFKQSLRLLPDDNDARENLQKAMTEQKEKQQPQNGNEKQQPQPQQPQQKKQQQKQQPKMDKQMMEQKFKELEDQEKQLQKELQKQKADQQDGEKDW